MLIVPRIGDTIMITCQSVVETAGARYGAANGLPSRNAERSQVLSRNREIKY